MEPQLLSFIGKNIIPISMTHFIFRNWTVCAILCLGGAMCIQAAKNDAILPIKQPSNAPLTNIRQSSWLRKSANRPDWENPPIVLIVKKMKKIWVVQIDFEPTLFGNWLAALAHDLTVKPI